MTESAASILVGKLAGRNPLDDDDKQAIARLPIRRKEFDARERIVGYGDKPHDCCLIVEGFAARSLTMDGGARQIFSIHLPGDIPDILSLHTSVMDHDLQTLTPCVTGLIPHTALRRLCADRPNVAAAFWRETLLDAAIFRQWIASLGRRDAMSRTAHLLAELHFRSRAIGLEKGGRFPLPLTQIDLADCLGQSIVHTNRVLTDLRQSGAIDYDKHGFHLIDAARLEQMCGFDPLYLISPRG